jgi:hypothetical protein
LGSSQVQVVAPATLLLKSGQAPHVSEGPEPEACLLAEHVQVFWPVRPLVVDPAGHATHWPVAEKYVSTAQGVHVSVEPVTLGRPTALLV